MKVPVYFELDSGYAAMLPAKDGGVRVITKGPYHLADFMQEGSMISREEFLKLSGMADEDLKE